MKKFLRYIGKTFPVTRCVCFIDFRLSMKIFTYFTTTTKKKLLLLIGERIVDRRGKLLTNFFFAFLFIVSRFNN